MAADIYNGAYRYAHDKVVCPKCGKEFLPTADWAFKTDNGCSKAYYCGYNCYRAATARKKPVKRHLKGKTGSRK